MPNVKNLTKQQNSKIWSKERECSCKIKEICPLKGKYLHQCMIYKSQVTTNTIYIEYSEEEEREFKSRHDNNMQSFRYITHINDTELSKYLWALKANGTDYHVKGSVKSYRFCYKYSTRRCDLYLTKKWLLL